MNEVGFRTEQPMGQISHDRTSNIAYNRSTQHQVCPWTPVDQISDKFPESEQFRKTSHAYTDKRPGTILPTIEEPLQKDFDKNSVSSVGPTDSHASPMHAALSKDHSEVHTCACSPDGGKMEISQAERMLLAENEHLRLAIQEAVSQQIITVNRLRLLRHDAESLETALHLLWRLTAGPVPILRHVTTTADICEQIHCLSSTEPRQGLAALASPQADSGRAREDARAARKPCTAG